VTRSEAYAALDDIENRLDPTAQNMVDVIRSSMNQPHLPVLLRVMAIAVVSGTYAESLVHHVDHKAGHNHKPVQKMEYLPDIILGLRAAADLFEEANRLNTH
jgi:hypothetical protein